MNNKLKRIRGRETLVGFLDWKSTALVGYEIMLEENIQ